MPLWLRNFIMLGVFLAWVVYIALIFIGGEFPPLPAWSVPGVTYALLSGRVIRFGREGLSVDEEEKKK